MCCCCNVPEFESTASTLAIEVRTVHVVAAALPRHCRDTPSDYPRGTRGRRRRDTPSDDPRGTHGVAATRPRTTPFRVAVASQPSLGRDRRASLVGVAEKITHNTNTRGHKSDPFFFFRFGLVDDGQSGGQSKSRKRCSSLRDFLGSIALRSISKSTQSWRSRSGAGSGRAAAATISAAASNRASGAMRRLARVARASTPALRLRPAKRATAATGV